MQFFLKYSPKNIYWKIVQMFQMFQMFQLSIDSFDEYCGCHPRMRTYGRLMNWARAGTPEANVDVQPYQFSQLKGYMDKVPRGVLFVANRRIEPMEELRYEYGDKACIDLFSPSSSSSSSSSSAKKQKVQKVPILSSLENQNVLPGIEQVLPGSESSDHNYCSKQLCPTDL